MFKIVGFEHKTVTDEVIRQYTIDEEEEDE